MLANSLPVKSSIQKHPSPQASTAQGGDRLMRLNSPLRSSSGLYKSGTAAWPTCSVPSSSTLSCSEHKSKPCSFQSSVAVTTTALWRTLPWISRQSLFMKLMAFVIWFMPTAMYWSLSFPSSASSLSLVSNGATASVTIYNTGPPPDFSPCSISTLYLYSSTFGCRSILSLRAPFLAHCHCELSRLLGFVLKMDTGALSSLACPR
mmetsp:Transcript_9361/g.17532  ORF Transcript_9361/g.17532 Transcript_9361/m.17532 type:complete len:205 (-) Transcript_9361:198-812(-)